MSSRRTSFTVAAGVAGALALVPTLATAHDNHQGQGNGPEGAPGQMKKPLSLDVKGALAGGGTFEGTISNLVFAYTAGQLRLSGTLEGMASGSGRNTRVQQAFSDVAATLTEDSHASSSGMARMNLQQDVCDILFLDLGPIFLDLLGLQVNLSRIILDINAIPGPGNLLGNLLCAIVGLLDPRSGLNLGGILGRILNNLLGALNSVLGGL